MRVIGEYVTGSWRVWQDDADDAAPAKKKKPKAPRRLTGKCWMAEDFPMTLHQLLPILEVGPLCARAHAHVLHFRATPHAAQMRRAVPTGCALGSVRPNAVLFLPLRCSCMCYGEPNHARVDCFKNAIVGVHAFSLLYVVCKRLSACVCRWWGTPTSTSRAWPSS